MKSIFEKLQDYFDKTSENKIKADWQLTSKYDEVESPTIEEYLHHWNTFIKLDNVPPDLDQNNFVNNIKNPNFTSDFFLNKLKWKKQVFHSKDIYLIRL
jgi:hypothetical protein